MLSRLLRKSKPIKLGRWSVTDDIKIQEQRINWANHDHCGSEICEKGFDNKKEKKQEKKINNNDYEKQKKEVESWTKRLEDMKKQKQKEKKEIQKNIKINVDEKKLFTKMEPFDEMLPFCM